MAACHRYITSTTIANCWIKSLSKPLQPGLEREAEVSIPRFLKTCPAIPLEEGFCCDLVMTSNEFDFCNNPLLSSLLIFSSTEVADLGKEVMACVVVEGSCCRKNSGTPTLRIIRWKPKIKVSVRLMHRSRCSSRSFSYHMVNKQTFKRFKGGGTSKDIA